MRVDRTLRFTGLLCCLFLGACGGGEKVVEVKGKLVKSGEPVTPSKALPPGDPGVVVRFQGMGEIKDSFAAKVDPFSGAFVVPGNAGKGIPAGQYKIEVKVGPFGQDELKGKFSAEKSKILRTIESGKEIVIDLDNPNG